MGVIAFAIAFVLAAAVIAGIWGWKVLKEDLEAALRIAFDDLRF